jgi:signal transduction histidine kinase
MTVAPDMDEERMLRAVLHQNAESIFLARQRAERDLERTRQSLEQRTAQLAESLALMQATLDATADGILATDNAGRVTGCNAQFVRMWDIPREVLDSRDHEALLAAMSDRMPDAGHFRAGVDAVLSVAPIESFDILELADGSVFERVTRVQRADDRVTGRVWSYRDVTDRARSEAALREARAQAEAASRAKGAFLAMMSHELRTPLNAISGYAELMELEIHGAVTPAQRHSLERIRASQRHLLTLIDEILMHATLEAGGVRYEMQELVVRDAILHACSLVQAQADARHVALHEPDCDAGTTARTDAGKLHHILLNLLSNAVKFTEAGGHVDLTCEVRDGYVHLDIRDTGIGISDVELDVIFQPFVQVGAELTRTAYGTGLGLAVSRSLARGMGGDITVQSEPGEGSVFSLILPAGTGQG